MVPRRKVTVPLYGVVAMMYLSFDEYRRTTGDDESFDGTDACVLPLIADNGASIVGVAFKDLKAATHSTIAHEAVHAAWRTLDIVGARVDSDNHEALAYLVGWFVTEITKFVDAYRAAESSEAPAQ